MCKICLVIHYCMYSAIYKKLSFKYYLFVIIIHCIFNSNLADVFGGPRALLYTGIQLVYDDREEILRPNTEYDYAVEAYNSRGYVSSVWATGTTFQAAPTDTPTPQVRVCISLIIW